MPLIHEAAVIQKRLDALTVVTYQAGENMLTAGSRTGRLLILKKGAVAIIKEKSHSSGKDYLAPTCANGQSLRVFLHPRPRAQINAPSRI